jgi:hypothetical protein
MNERIYSRLGARDLAYPGHDLIRGQLGGCRGEIEGPALGHNLESLAGGIVEHLARPAMRQVAFELTAHIGRQVTFQIVSELNHEFFAANHKPILRALIAKCGESTSRNVIFV